MSPRMSLRNEVPAFPRRITQIATCGAENGFVLLALADDGTLWATDHTHSNAVWSEVPALPPRTAYYDGRMP